MCHWHTEIDKSTASKAKILTLCAVLCKEGHEIVSGVSPAEVQSCAPQVLAHGTTNLEARFAYAFRLLHLAICSQSLAHISFICTWVLATN
ncbi:hypothetical protein BaRGS_00025750 [Batillaria attramentaria]|uniref:Uncharacterized protein n=1 Tax=Batillaria attramentaria TaxID=370345 RepID=A0ABD0K778_9CAEN